jgi:hypothetical protein
MSITSLLIIIVLVIIIAYVVFWVVENPTFRTQHPVIYKIAQPSGQCTINTSGNPYNVACMASDPTNLTYKYLLYVYSKSEVLGGATTILNKTFTASSFSYNFTLPANHNYSYVIYSYSGNNSTQVK